MAHQDEYHAAMLTAIELVWGEGFLAPGGEGNVRNLVEGLDVRGARILDIGCGLGGPACTLAGKYGARVVGSDLEADLLRRSGKLALDRALEGQVSLVQVEPGPLAFRDGSFDLVLSSGAFTQTEDKLGIFRECLRVLKPGGWISAYDWMKCEGEYSKDMLYFFEMEGLSYAMETPDGQKELLREAGFEQIQLDDRSDWYRDRSAAEYQRLRGEHWPRMLELMGREQADHFAEDWRAMKVVCAKGEMLQVYSRGRKPA